MNISIILTLSILLLLAYLFDITASKTKIPSVILLLVLGFCVNLISSKLNIQVLNLHPVLPILGTVGLILIVLEGSLELEINKTKLPLILKSSVLAFLPILFISFGIAFYLHHFWNLSFKIGLANAIPLSIISSAIAIPSARSLIRYEREFVTYESSLSDIFGVIFFNFITLNDNYGTETYGSFLFEMVLMLLISFLFTLLLAVLLNNIKHHIKFVPIIILVILIYAVSKIFHLPALIFILIFGLFLGNIEELRNFKMMKQFHTLNFSSDVKKFKEISSELAFLVRALFFILFGFLINPADILNKNTMLMAALITAVIFISRFILFRMFKVTVKPLLFIAPRGLITILLFLSIPKPLQTDYINQSLVIQVIILTAFVLMIGLMFHKKNEGLEEIAES